MTLVVDASAVVEYLLRASPVAAALIRVEDIHAPELIDLEFASALRSLLQRRSIEDHRLRMLVEDYLDLPIHLHPHRPLLPRIIALRENFSSYDAAYVALAESIGGVLFTADASLARAVRQHTAVDVAMKP